MEVSRQSSLIRRRCDAVKENVSAISVARNFIEQRSGRLREGNGRLRGMCPICGHGNHSEALSVSGELNVFQCFACGESGDVIDLARLAGGFGSVAETVAWLGFTYDVDLPQRPESWFKKQTRQERVRADIERVRQESYRRRIFKYIIAPQITIEDPKEQREELKRAWEDLKSVPLRPHG